MNKRAGRGTGRATQVSKESWHRGQGEVRKKAHMLWLAGCDTTSKTMGLKPL